MNVRLTALCLAIAAGFQGPTALAQSGAFRIRIDAAADASSSVCAAALKSELETGAPGLFDVSLNDGNQGSSASNGLEIDVGPLSGHGGASIDLVAIPYLFRDVSHFQAFRRSDLYQELRKVDSTQELRRPWLSVAYGTSFQLFSIDRALTEPKHFTRQGIGGSSHAMLYSDFGALPSVMPSFSSSRDVDVAEFGSFMVKGLEKPLSDAIDLGLHRKAKFMNQTFSGLEAVIFNVGFLNESVFQKLPPHIVTIIFEIADRAADNCSETNYVRDKSTIEALKAAGVQIVPVNRAAFSEAGWKYGMTFNLGGASTIGDVDRIAKMGPKPIPKRLPSQVIRSKRKGADLVLKHASENEAKRRKAEMEIESLSEASSGANALDAVWSHEKEVILAQLASRPALFAELGLPKDPAQSSVASKPSQPADSGLLRYLAAEGERYIATNPEKCDGYCKSTWLSLLAWTAAATGDVEKRTTLLRSAWSENPSVYLAVEASVSKVPEAEVWLREIEGKLSTRELDAWQGHPLGFLDFRFLIEYYRKSGRQADMERVVALAERKALEAGVQQHLVGVYVAAGNFDLAAATYIQRVQATDKPDEVGNWPAPDPGPSGAGLARIVAPAIAPPLLRVAAAARSLAATKATGSETPVWIDLATHACSLAVAAKDLSLVRVCESELAPALKDQNVSAAFMMRDIVEVYWSNGEKDRARRIDPGHAEKLESHDRMTDAIARGDWAAAFASVKGTQFPEIYVRNVWRSVAGQNDPDLVKRLLAEEVDEGKRIDAVNAVLSALVRPNF
jgi:TRAP-type C4-dicarboxylate transport system substrate-binding protein